MRRPRCRAQPVFHNPRSSGLAQPWSTRDPVARSHREALTLFDQPGIGVEDLAWIHRDQYVHYVQLAHALGDAEDWPRLRQDLLRALTAAFSLDAGMGDGLTPRQLRALQVLDEVGRERDPATEWPAFFEALWSRRDDIRADLPLTEARCHIRRSPRTTPS